MRPVLYAIGAALCVVAWIAHGETLAAFPAGILTGLTLEEMQ